MIGTPFVTKDEIHNKRIEHLDKKPWEQEARDDKGRKHFYGAFTGAWRETSVGYKSTVGSKEGFQPQTFISSRTQKNKEMRKQDVADFMDEEDLGDHNLGEQGADADPLLRVIGQDNQAPVALFVSADVQKFAKGMQLMEAMGFKDRGAFSKQIGEQSSSDEEQLQLEGCGNLEQRRQQKRQGRVQFKKDQYGLGYLPTEQDKEMQRLYEESQHGGNNPFRRGLGEKQSKVIKMSEFNEDEDDMEDEADGEHMAKIYSKDTFRENVQKDGALESYVNLKNQQVKHNKFVFSSVLQTAQITKTAAQNTFQNIPDDYNPYAMAENAKKTSLAPKKLAGQSSKLNAFKRSKILENSQPSEAVTSRLPAQLQRLIPSQLRSDPGKMKRFEAFWLEEQGQLIVFDVPNNMMTGSQLRKEKDEFTGIIKAYNKQQQIQEESQKYKSYSSQTKQLIEQKVERAARMQAFDWIPERLLLMRFQLADIPKRAIKPQEEKPDQNPKKAINFVKGGIIGCSGAHIKETKESGDSYFNQISEQFRRQGGEESVQVDDKDGRQIDQDDAQGEGTDWGVEQAEAVQESGKPPKSLFESIFNDDGDDDEY